MTVPDPGADRLAEIHAACFQTPRPWTPKEIEAMLGDPATFLCALPQGFAMGRTSLDEAELLTLAVLPEARRGGIGRNLLSLFEAEALRRGTGDVFLEVSAHNLPAIGLYESTGYRCVGQRRRYYRAPDGSRIDALVLRRRLDPPVG